MKVTGILLIFTLVDTTNTVSIIHFKNSISLVQQQRNYIHVLYSLVSNIILNNINTDIEFYIMACDRDFKRKIPSAKLSTRFEDKN